jgi:hypothetical protein
MRRWSALGTGGVCVAFGMGLRGGECSAIDTQSSAGTGQLCRETCVTMCVSWVHAASARSGREPAELTTDKYSVKRRGRTCDRIALGARRDGQVGRLEGKAARDVRGCYRAKIGMIARFDVVSRVRRVHDQPCVTSTILTTPKLLTKSRRPRLPN